MWLLVLLTLAVEQLRVDLHLAERHHFIYINRLFSYLLYYASFWSVHAVLVLILLPGPCALGFTLLSLFVDAKGLHVV